ncbi:MAG: hypothetical protein Q4G69_11765, partial [Planctomycetia bacterium]|nr:hypothetical protein [Planctomycetia bacterium]
LSDLSWIRQQRIRLIFPALPLSDPEDREVFLDILRSSQKSLKNYGIDLQICFLEKDRVLTDRGEDFSSG